MTHIYMRRICEAVFVGVLLARHWFPWLQPVGDHPATFLLGISCGIVLIVTRAVQVNRAE